MTAVILRDKGEGPKSDRTNDWRGVQEREVAFDFKNALNEYVKYIDRMHMATQIAEKREKGGENDEEEDNEDVEVSGLMFADLRTVTYCIAVLRNFYDDYHE